MGKQKIAMALSIWVLAGCTEQSAKDQAEQKLSQIHNLPSAPVAMPLADEPVLIGDYQATNNPFLSPYRSDVSDTPPAKTQTDQQASSKADDKPTYKPEPSDSPKPNASISLPKAPSSVIVSSQPKRLMGKSVPKPNRTPNQPLEKYDLQALRFVGVMTAQNWQTAMIATPDGLVHQVGVGQYLGRHHGQIVAINEQAIELMETVMVNDEQGEQYYQRTVFLPLGAK